MGATPADDRGVEAGAERRVVAIIGDGSMTGGMAFEGLNNLGHSGRKAIIILNDNGRSYAPTMSKLTESVARVRINPQYRRQRARLEQLIDRMPLADQLHKGLDATTAAAARVLRAPGVLRGPRRQLHRPVRRPRHPRPREGAAPRRQRGRARSSSTS